MRTDILDLHHFYEAPLGKLARDTIADNLNQICGEGADQSIAGFGYTTPWLDLFPTARRVIALAPDAQGVMRWPHPATGREQSNRACLVHEGFWPLPDRSMDKIIIIHGLEEVRDSTRLLREVWRVLADDGQLIIVATQRRGLWAAYDTTPLAAGRPWLRVQLNRLLERSLFTPIHVKRALHYLPFNWRLNLRYSGKIENIGRKLWPGFCGLLIVEAKKSLALPATGKPQRALNVIRPKLSGAFLPGVRPATPYRHKSEPAEKL